MSRQFRFFAAIVAAVSLAIPLAGCGKKTADEQVVEEVVVEQSDQAVEEEVEEAPIPDASPSEVALWYARAIAGDRAELDAYDPDLYSDDWVANVQDTYVTAVNRSFDDNLTEEQQESYAEAIAGAFSRVEIEVVAEEIEGDDAVVTLAIKGFDKDEGGVLAAEETVREGSTDRDESLFQTMLKTWQLAPIADEPLFVEIPLVRDEATGAWTIEGLAGLRAKDQIAFALENNEVGLENAKARAAED